MPIAVAATQIAWGLSIAPKGFNANASTLVADTLQWAGNYLTLCVEGENYAVQVITRGLCDLGSACCCCGLALAVTTDPESADGCTVLSSEGRQRIARVLHTCVATLSRPCYHVHGKRMLNMAVECRWGMWQWRRPCGPGQRT